MSNAFGKIFAGNDGDGDHIVIDANREYGFREENTENSIPNVLFIFRSPESIRVGGGTASKLGFCAEEHASDYYPNSSYLFSIYRREIFNSDNLENFKYLVYDAKGQPVYSKASFIAAGPGGIDLQGWADNGGGSLLFDALELTVDSPTLDMPFYITFKSPQSFSFPSQANQSLSEALEKWLKENLSDSNCKIYLGYQHEYADIGMSVDTFLPGIENNDLTRLVAYVR